MQQCTRFTLSALCRVGTQISGGWIVGYKQQITNSILVDLYSYIAAIYLKLAAFGVWSFPVLSPEEAAVVSQDNGLEWKGQEKVMQAQQEFNCNQGLGSHMDKMGLSENRVYSQ